MCFQADKASNWQNRFYEAISILVSPPPRQMLSFQHGSSAQRTWMKLFRKLFLLLALASLSPRSRRRRIPRQLSPQLSLLPGAATLPGSITEPSAAPEASAAPSATQTQERSPPRSIMSPRLRPKSYSAQWIRFCSSPASTPDCPFSTRSRRRWLAARRLRNTSSRA